MARINTTRTKAAIYGAGYKTLGEFYKTLGVSQPTFYCWHITKPLLIKYIVETLEGSNARNAKRETNDE